MTLSNYDGHAMWLNFIETPDAIRHSRGALRTLWHQTDDIEKCHALSEQLDQRHWIVREMDSYPLHSVIEAAVLLVRPIDWQQLFLEWPHVSQGDRSKVAYTQNEIKGQKNIQTVTSVGKYLNRHFPLPDHTIRDLVARHGSAARYQFVHTTAEMIYHLHRGPGSCMVWSGEDSGVNCTDGVRRHPYEAYNPKYGWHMAVRIEGDETIGRALCMTDAGGTKYFVRTYARPSSNGGYSETDNGMENWLAEQGYVREHQWREGTKLAYHETRDHFLAPFLDGNYKSVRLSSDTGSYVLVVDNCADYRCDQTGGCPSDNSRNENTFECANCGEETDDDDGYWVGRGEDTRVCPSCLDNDYVYAYGRRGNQYYILTDDAVYVDTQSEWYDSNYLNDNEIVELENGQYHPMDESVEIDCEWYSIDDERICRFEDTDEYGLTGDGWQCEQSCNWYTDAIEYVVVDGSKYHPDHAPEREESTPTQGE